MAILKNLIVNGVARVIGDLTASKIIKQGGVSSQFLKADGSVDSTSYYHSGNLTSSVIGNLGTLSNNISGNAITATNVDWSGVTNKPNYAAGDSVGGSANYLRWEAAASSSYARKIPISWYNDTETTTTRFRATYYDSLTYRTNTNTISSNISGNAATATNSDKLDGYHATCGYNKPWGTIPVITPSGFMDVGKHFEFHYDNDTGSDYSTALICTGNYSNIVNLPSESGTLALTSQIPTVTDYYWANIKISNQSNNNTNPTFNNITANSYLTFGEYGSSFTSDIRNSWRTNIYGDTINKSRLKTVRTNVTIDNFSEIYGSGLTWATGDTHGYLSVSYSSGKAWIGGGSANSLNWSTYLVTGKNIGSQSVSYATSAGYSGYALSLNSITLPTSSSNSANTVWCKFATITFNMSAWRNAAGYFLFSGEEYVDYRGILEYHFRASSSATVISLGELSWLTKSHDYASVIAVKVADNVYDLYVNNCTTYSSTRIYHFSANNSSFKWNVGSWTATKPTAAITASDVGRVYYATNAGSADTAGSVDWSGVTNRPTNISQFNNDAGYKTTDTTYSTATSNTLGLVKIGYTANGRKYPVELSNGQMYVNVPWTDTNTNTWRPITDSYSGTDSNTSLSQKGGKAIYDALINGYATNAGSSTYSNTLEVQDVRGSDIIPSKFDPYRITGWFNESTGLLNGNWCSGITVKGWHDGYSSWQLAGYSSTSFGSHGLFFREAASDSSWRDWIQVITSDNISSQTVAIANLARTLSQDGTIKLYVHNNNELNFGGTNASTTIYFGYRAADSRAIPTSFVFGGSTGSATLTANGFIKKGSSDSYVLLGGGGHKALSQFVQTSGDQSISGTKTFTGTIKVNRAESTTGFFQTSDIRYKNIIEHHYSLSDKIAQLPIIKYKWTDRDDNSVRIGSSAQSVMSIIPELVSYDNNTDFYSLDYATLGAVAGISACKEVEMLKQKIKELEQEIIILKSKYNG